MASSWEKFEELVEQEMRKIYSEDMGLRDYESCE